MSEQEEIIQRILHIVDLKISIYEMGQSYNRTVEMESQVNNQGNGFHMGIYGLVKESESKIIEQGELIQKEITDLMLLVTQRSTKVK